MASGFFDKLQVEFIDKDKSVQVVADTIGRSGEVPERYVRHEIEVDTVTIDGTDGYSLPVIDMSRLINPDFSEEEIAKLGSACEDWGYFHVHQDRGYCEEVISNYHGDMVIPIIDLNKLLSPQSSGKECVKLRSACQYWGFFQLINHGVPEEVIENFRSNIVEFFSLPLDAKKEYSQLPNSLEGYGQTFVFSEDQKLDWGDMLYLQVHPTNSRDLKFWPTYPASFRQSVDAYSSETKSLALCLFEFMAKAVGAETESLLGIFEEQPRGMRMNYYPPCRQADKVIGLSPHTDVVGLTLLLQVNDVQGLQIKRDGKWFSVDALSGAFIVNIGDVLEILSNGKFKSVEHRAMIHPNKERISAALFHYPRYNLVLSPLPEFVKDGKVNYRSISYNDFMMQYLTQKRDGRNRLERLKLEH